jgi:hypothetical protein
LRAREEAAGGGVRGVFPEGKPVFRDGGIRDKDHIQICIRKSDSMPSLHENGKSMDFLQFSQ